MVRKRKNFCHISRMARQHQDTGRDKSQLEEEVKKEVEEKIWKEAEEHLRVEFEKKMERELEAAKSAKDELDLVLGDEDREDELRHEIEEKYKREYEEMMHREQEKWKKKEEEERRKREREEREKQDAEVARLEAEEQAKIELEDRIRRYSINYDCIAIAISTSQLWKMSKLTFITFQCTGKQRLLQGQSMKLAYNMKQRKELD